MKALVVGGAGFIGSHLCDALLRRAPKILMWNIKIPTPRHSGFCPV